MQQIYLKHQHRSAIVITLWHGCSPANLLHIFITPFPKNKYGGLLLNVPKKGYEGLLLCTKTNLWGIANDFHNIFDVLGIVLKFHFYYWVNLREFIIFYSPWNHQKTGGFSGDFRGDTSKLICLILETKLKDAPFQNTVLMY